MTLSTLPSSFLLIFTMPFTGLLNENKFISWKVSSLPLSFRKSFPSLRIPCLSFSLPATGNYETSAACPRFLICLFFPASKPILNLISSRCSTRWSISPNRSARWSIPPLLTSLPLILPALSFMLPKQSQNCQFSNQKTQGPLPG